VTSDKGSGDKRRIDTRTAVALGLVLLVLIFVFENGKHVEIRFLAPTASVPLWVALVLPLIVGVGIGYLLAQRRSKD
jgi:uncharacterized integral membrane protein